METHIFYFSSTGNGLKIARGLAEKLGDTEIFPIPRVISGAVDLSADRIGLIAMVIGGAAVLAALLLRRFHRREPDAVGDGS